MRALIRVDCSPAIGMGHAMRCLALAGQLGHRGADVAFATRGPGSPLTELCAASGFEIHALPELDVGWEDDAAHTLAILDAKKRPDWVVVDHYGLDARWERRLRPRCGAILAIDDLADRAHDCDLLLDQNFHDAAAARYLDRVPDTCQMLLGPRYALLRAAFSASNPPARDGVLRRVLISYGGTDSTGETLKALSALALAALPGLSARVVIGPGNPRAAEIRECCARLPGAEALESVADMSSLLVNADIAIGAGGVSMWERCAMGVPSIVTAIARNQEPSSQAMGEAGLCIYLGTAAETSAKSIADVLRGLAATPALLRHIASSTMALVDGKGAERVADRMQWPEVSLRRAGPADCGLSFAWRNHVRVDHFWVWTPGYAAAVTRDGTSARVHVVGPILWEPDRRARLPRSVAWISVFDIAPLVPDVNIRDYGLLDNYFSPDNASAFLDGILRAVRAAGLQLPVVIKPKRRPDPLRDPGYQARLQESREFELLDSDAPITEVVSRSAVVIVYPFSSAAFVADWMAVPAIYFDPTGKVARAHELGAHIAFARSSAELESLLRSIDKPGRAAGRWPVAESAIAGP